ncbi:hypothetical protein TRIUR3_19736 [Triticum urartu]|uniref:Uncharacterized protein n=1 Tax=Triticum urartu TaxID=4572 RepID=M8AQC1_TRIUA|nr:hypothetical protein TRIUR3_19736 [Triticum urartu]
MMLGRNVRLNVDEIGGSRNNLNPKVRRKSHDDHQFTSCLKKVMMLVLVNIILSMSTRRASDDGLGSITLVWEDMVGWVVEDNTWVIGVIGKISGMGSGSSGERSGGSSIQSSPSMGMIIE